jgi:hypothetical protein
MIWETQNFLVSSTYNGGVMGFIEFFSRITKVGIDRAFTQETLLVSDRIDDLTNVVNKLSYFAKDIAGKKIAAAQTQV